MSNSRRTARGNRYRSGYLRSPAWFGRRDRWFRTQARTGVPLTCEACDVAADRDELELHHVVYTGVVEIDGRWHARERHPDLIPLHPACHELLHRLIDRDAVLARHRDRRTASTLALKRLHAKLTAVGGGA